MADVIITMKAMANGVEVDMKKMELEVLQKLMKFAYDVDITEENLGEMKKKQGVRVEVEDIAFGLKALKIDFAMDEAKGATDPLETDITSLESVKSCEVIGITRAMG